jgi:hypothetical protein
MIEVPDPEPPPVPTPPSPGDPQPVPPAPEVPPPPTAIPAPGPSAERLPLRVSAPDPASCRRSGRRRDGGSPTESSISATASRRSALDHTPGASAGVFAGAGQERSSSQRSRHSKCHHSQARV